VYSKILNDMPKRKNIKETKVDDELSLYDFESKKFYMLNPAASIIWSLCDGLHTVEQIASELKKRFEDAGESVSHDACRIVEKFKKQGLLE